MGKQRILIAVAALFMFQSTVVFANDNPFERGESIDIGSDSQWQINNKTATRSGSGSGGFYHLFYDRKQLRLRITDGAEDNEGAAKKYQHFAVEDVQVDGKRLPIFQWCLGNQQKHSRFLEQGLKVKQGVCNNQGEKGAFILRLNAATLDILKNGKKLSFKIRPFRSSIRVNFNISDFSDVVAKLSAKVKLTKKVPSPAAKAVAVKKCKVMPPKNFTVIKPAEYACNDAIAKAGAEASIAAMVKERKRQVQLAAERKQKAAAKELADKKAAEEKLAAEQAALAATEASQKEVSSDITNKMLAVCKKKWDVGEHRCYCEEFLVHAPVGIESDPTCAAN